MQTSSRWLLGGLLCSVALGGCDPAAPPPDFQPDSQDPTPAADCAVPDDDSDLQDDNCNGYIDEDRVLAGSVVITELMIDSAVPDNYGEYIELYNRNERPVDLFGYTLEEADGGSITFDRSLVIEGESYLLLAVSKDETVNGGLTPDEVYSGLELPNDRPLDLQLRRGSELIHSVAIKPAEVEGARAGSSVSFDPSSEFVLTADDARAWCGAASSFGTDGQYGTPGRANDLCPQIDHDGDGYAGNEGDCDDRSAAKNPGMTEVCGDQIDQDCSGADLVCAENDDLDKDGYTEVQGDCDDNQASIKPGATDECGDGIDQDCSGADTPCQDEVDNDGDGLSEVQKDCDDYDASIYPKAPEVCGDDIDQDCNGADVTCDEDVDDDGDTFTENQGDCNDVDPASYPKAPEVCGDGIDQDCVYGDVPCPDDIDDDKDGFSEKQGDCDDTNALIEPGAPDVLEDGVDNDCDGLVDEGMLREGDLIISEVMRDPAAVSDSVGEYLELYNTTERVIRLDGLTVVDESDGERFSITGPLELMAESFAVLGRSADEEVNGGIPVKFAYKGLILQNSGELRLSLRAGDLVLDAVGLAGAVSGAATEVDPTLLTSLDNDDPDSWCVASSSASRESTDRGTPGWLNALCAHIDHDLDGYAARDGDCDDTSAGLSPKALEVCGDGIDQDCDGKDTKCVLEIDDDQDGYTETDGDCDDADAARNPAAAEVCGDGIDQDCLDGDRNCPEDLDDDGDGFTERQGDCDDAHPGVSPGADDDTSDGIDSNCDGLIDEGMLEVGDLIITELLRNPEAVSDSVGEFIEVYNTTERVLYLQGIEVIDETDGESFVIAEPVKVLAESYAVLGRLADLESNGFIPVDYVYDGMILENSGELRLRLLAGGLELDGVVTTVSEDGASVGLDPHLLDAAANDSPDAWCSATSQISGQSTDLGTPGAPNDACRGIDHDGDGFSLPQGDCDDEDAGVHPGADEVCDDGMDNDCNGSDLSCSEADACSQNRPECPSHDDDGDGQTEDGGDCDDTDRTIFTGAPDDAGDLWNLVDNDCDGVVDDDLIRMGDVIFSEIMKNPPGVSNTDGEWFELFNTTERDIDLMGWTMKDTLGHSITINESLVVEAGWQIVLGVNEDEVTNGGVPVDFEYHGLVLPNDGEGGLELSARATRVDQVIYDDRWPDWPGYAMQLGFQWMSALANDDRTRWCFPSYLEETSGKCVLVDPTPGSWNTLCECMPE